MKHEILKLLMFKIENQTQTHGRMQIIDLLGSNSSPLYMTTLNIAPVSKRNN